MCPWPMLTGHSYSNSRPCEEALDQHQQSTSDMLKGNAVETTDKRNAERQATNSRGFSREGET